MVATILPSGGAKWPRSMVTYHAQRETAPYLNHLPARLLNVKKDTSRTIDTGARFNLLSASGQELTPQAGPRMSAWCHELTRFDVVPSLPELTIGWAVASKRKESSNVTKNRAVLKRGRALLRC